MKQQNAKCTTKIRTTADSTEVDHKVETSHQTESAEIDQNPEDIRTDQTDIRITDHDVTRAEATTGITETETRAEAEIRVVEDTTPSKITEIDRTTDQRAEMEEHTATERTDTPEIRTTVIRTTTATTEAENRIAESKATIGAETTLYRTMTGIRTGITIVIQTTIIKTDIRNGKQETTETQALEDTRTETLETNQNREEEEPREIAVKSVVEEIRPQEQK